MLIDCEHCEMRDIACDDCVINVLLGAPAPASEEGGGLSAVELTDDTAAALHNLAVGGLVPPLRHTAWKTGTG